MEPLPSYNKVYSLVSRIENQKAVGLNNSTVTEASALIAKAVEQAKNTNNFAGKKQNFSKKGDRLCNFCTTNTEEPADSKQKSGESSFNSALLAQMVQMEVQKLMKSKNSVEESHVNTSYFADFAGSSSNFSIKDGDNWVIDSGASSHVTGNIKLLKDLRPGQGKNTVTLPDGSVKMVTKLGCAVLNNCLSLHNVLYVPEFKYNLISVSKLVCDSSIQVQFHSSGCIMQDQLNNRIVAQGRLEKNLFVLCKDETDCILNVKTLNNVDKSLVTVKDSNIWHNRMGHPSSEVLQHLPLLDKCVKHKVYEGSKSSTPNIYYDDEDDVIPVSIPVSTSEFIVPLPSESVVPLTSESSTSESVSASNFPTVISSSYGSGTVYAPYDLVPRVETQVDSNRRRSDRDRRPPIWMKNYV
ncbi:Copia protein [Senna tora]|uniref:Copia protein n=1 Tax=Senna tora TaxID=362788 RepID=A0A834T4V7_9FABA|nr:Copia protein [Senna tora]